MSTELELAKARKSTAYNPSRAIDTGTPVTVGATATLILASSGRKGHLLYNGGTSVIFVGGSSDITAASGMPVQAGETFTFDQNAFTYSGDIYAITATGTSVVRRLEFY